MAATGTLSQPLPGFPSSLSSTSTLPSSSSSSNTNSPTLFSNSPSKTRAYASTSQAISNATALLNTHASLLHRVRIAQEAHRESFRQLRGRSSSQRVEELLNLPLVPSTTIDSDVYGEVERESDAGYGSDSEDGHDDQEEEKKRWNRSDLPPAKRARLQRYKNYVPEEETIRNDYSQRYVDGGEWPQNWVLGAEPERRFEEYPKQQRLLQLKKASVNQYSLPPTYIALTPPSASRSNLSQTINATLASMQPSKFDVILIDPPYSSSSSSGNSGFTWDNLQDLPIPSLAAESSFIFLWVGSGAGEGLERGREILAKWGYRRCEDVVWVRTNKDKYRGGDGPGTDPPTTSLLTRTKQHCLMGIRGTVRRSTDSWFVHCNVDTDVIIWEGDPLDPTRKPPEMYTLIENFCLGMRRLEVFGKLSSLRRGWVTALGPGQEELLPKAKDGSLEESGSVYIEGGDNNIPAVSLYPTSAGGGPSGTAAGEKQDSSADIDTGITATRWNQETWEESVRELSASAAASAATAGFGPQNGGMTIKAVVPMSSEIDALRPKSPMRPGQGGGGNHNNNGGNNNNNSSGGGGYGNNNHHHHGGGGGRGNMNNLMNTMAQPMAMSTGMGMGPPILRFGGSSAVVSGTGGNGGAGGGAGGRGGGGGGGNLGMSMANTQTHAMPMGGGGIMNMGMNPGMGMGMNAMNAMNAMNSGMGNMGNVGVNMGMGIPSMGAMGMNMGNMNMGMGPAGGGVGGSNMLIAQPMGSSGLGGGGTNTTVPGMDDMGWNPMMATHTGGAGMGMGGMGMGMGMNQQQRGGMAMNNHNMNNLNAMHMNMGNMNAFNGMSGMNGMNMNMMNPGLLNMGGANAIPNLQHMGMNGMNVMGFGGGNSSGNGNGNGGSGMNMQQQSWGGSGPF